MKRLKSFDQIAVTVLLFAVLIFFLSSCQKDEEAKTAEYNLEISESEANIRNGGHQFVFFPGSFTFVHTLINVNPQYGFNPQFTDSIVLQKILPEVTANINPQVTTVKYCALYKVIVFQQDIFPTYFLAYAPFSLQNKVTYYPNGGYNNNIYSFELQKSNLGWQDRFDYGCLKNKRDYIYAVSEITTDTTTTNFKVLAGNYLCNDLYRVKMVW